MTECTQTDFAFQAHFSRQVTGQFDGSTMTSDAGGLLLRETDRRLNLLPRLAREILPSSTVAIRSQPVPRCVMRRQSRSW